MPDVPVNIVWDNGSFSPDSNTVLIVMNGAQQVHVVAGAATSYVTNVPIGTILHIEVWSTTLKVDSKHVSFDFNVP